MKDGYFWPNGFWHDEKFLGDDSFVSSKKYSTFNAEEKMKNFLEYINEMAAGYRGNHLLIPFGGDFTFANARMNFENMDRLIDYFNKNNG